MKKAIFAVLLSCTLGLTSCIGSFSAFNSLLDWNHEVTDSKWANEAIFLGLNIIPVYGLFMLGDMVIFNTIEFWTGDNPIGMKDGEQDVQIVEKGGERYRITASRNMFHIEQLGAQDEVLDRGTLKFHPKSGTWKAKRAGKSMDVLQFSPDGQEITFLPGTEHATKAMVGDDLCEVRERMELKLCGLAAR